MSSVVPILVYAGLGTLGTALMFLGLRGRWSRIAPVCARCGHGVEAEPSALARPCPECGGRRDDLDGVRHFQRRMRRGLFWSGTIVFALALVLPGLLSVAGRRMTRLANVPNAATDEVIERLRTIDDPPMISAALRELGQRASAQALTSDELRRSLDAFMALPASDERWLAIEGGPMVVAAAQAGIIDEATLLGLGRSLSGAIELELPLRVREGAMIRPPLEMSTLVLAVERRLDLLSLEDAAGVGPSKVDGMRRPLERIGQQAPHYGFLRFDCPPGKYDFVAELEARYSIGQTPGAVTRRAGGAPSAGAVTASERITIPFSIEVVPADAPPLVPFVTDPTRSDEVRSAISVGEAYLVERGPESCFLVVAVELAAVDRLALAYRVEFELDGKVFEGNRMTAIVYERDGGVGMTKSSGPTSVTCPPEGIDRVTIRMVPDPAAVEHDPRVPSLWGETYEFRDVPLRRVVSPVRPRQSPFGGRP